MPVNDYLKRLLIETISNNVNELVLGFDGTPATSSDGSPGRPALTVTPTVRILDTNTLLVEADIPTTQAFDETLKEVYIQMKTSSGFTPISRHVFRPIAKTSNNEMKIQIIIEVK